MEIQAGICYADFILEQYLRTVFFHKEVSSVKTVLRGGFVVSGRGCRRADVLIDGEKIEKVGHIPPDLAAQSEIVDVTGCTLFPGFIAAHPHFALDVCTTSAAEDFERGSERRPSGAAPPRSSTSPAPIKENPLPTGLISGIKRRTASATATMAST